MAVQSVNQLKQWFETGDKPTQQQFWDLIESFMHREEGVAIENVSGLNDILQAKADNAALSNYVTLANGLVYVDQTGSLASLSHLTAGFVVVDNVGLCRPVESNVLPNYSTSFPSADAGWIWKLVLAQDGGTAGMLADRFVANSDYVYTLAAGFSVDKIKIKPDAAQTIRVGLTNNGEEIMFEETIAGGVWKTITVDVDAEGAAVNIYFNGMTVDNSVTIYKREL